MSRILTVATCAIVSGLWVTSPAAQEPPTFARLATMTLGSADAGISVRFSTDVPRETATALASRIAECRAHHAASAGKPEVVLAMLGPADWPALTANIYGMPHYSTVTAPALLIIPASWDQVSPLLGGSRDLLAGALGAPAVDRYVHLIAEHEFGHILTHTVLKENDLDAVLERMPRWYFEFVANSFAEPCLLLHAEDADIEHRGQMAQLALPGRFKRLEDWDRLMDMVDPDPYLMTREGMSNFAWYEVLTAQLASELHKVGFDDRLAALLRRQWARPGHLATADLVNDITEGAPAARAWLVEQGAIAR